MAALDSPRVEELRRRVNRDPASISFAALAEEYRRLGRYEDAIETCRAGLLRHPAYMSARVTLGRALIELGQYDDATVELEQVLSVAPENLAAIRALAEIHRRRAEMPESIESYVVAGAETVTAEPLAAEPLAAEPLAAEPLAAEPLAEEPLAAAAPSMPAPVAVQSSSVGMHAESPAIAGLESFLAAIQRARRDAFDVLPRASR